MDKCYNCKSTDLDVLDNAMVRCKSCGVVFDPMLMNDRTGSQMTWKRFFEFPNWRKEDYVLCIAVISLSLSICSTLVLGTMILYLYLLYLYG